MNDNSCADRILQMSTLGWGWGELWLSCKCQHICITQYPIFNSCKCQHYSLPVNPVGQTPSNPHHHKMRLLVSNTILSQEHVHCASDTLKSISHKKKTIPEFLILLCPLFSPPAPSALPHPSAFGGTCASNHCWSSRNPGEGLDAVCILWEGVVVILAKNMWWLI